MAVERTGTAVTINTASATSSQSITVPSDCDLAVLFFSGYSSGADSFFDDGGATLTLGGQSFTHRVRNPDVDDQGDIAAYTCVLPPTGSQLFAWAVNTGIDEGYLFGIVFYKGVDTTTPIKDVGSVEGNNITLTISSLDATGDDMSVCGCSPTNTPVVNNNSQTSLISIGPGAKTTLGYMGVAEKLGATSMSTGPNGYSGMVALVIGAAAIISATIDQHSFRFFSDNGSESGSTAKDALNTNINLSANDVTRVRFLLDATNDPTGKQFQLEYRRKPSGGSFGGWGKVN